MARRRRTKKPARKPSTMPAAPAPARDVERAALDRAEHRIVEEVGAAVEGKHLPLPVVLQRRGGPAAVDREAVAVGHVVALLRAAARDREGAGIDLRRLVGLRLHLEVRDAQKAAREQPLEIGLQLGGVDEAVLRDHRRHERLVQEHVDAVELARVDGVHHVGLQFAQGFVVGLRPLLRRRGASAQEHTQRYCQNERPHRRLLVRWFLVDSDGIGRANRLLTATAMARPAATSVR